MTKEKYLLALIKKKESWHLYTPIFPENLINIKLNPGHCYQGTFPLITEDNALFECYIESLKNIVIPIKSWISGSNKAIVFQVSSEYLEQDYIYEDQLKIYYPGGQSTIEFRIQVYQETLEIEAPLDSGIRIKPSKKVPEEGVLITKSKITYTLSEPIHLKLENKTKSSHRIVFESDDEIISPRITEVYIKDIWNQEWFVKQSTIDKLLGKLSFKSEPVKPFLIKVFMDNEVEASQNIHLLLTSFENYETPQSIENEQMYLRTKKWIFHLYIQRLVSPVTKRETNEMFDLAKACLNYNQDDFDMRLFFIWILIEYHHKKESFIELAKLAKYSEYYRKHTHYKLISILGQIANKEIGTSGISFESKVEVGHWLEELIKARYTASRNKKYDYYSNLYGKGIRHSFLFAEVVALMNKLPIIPDPTDRLYIISLSWAYNKRCIDKEWLNKLERHYYQLEKNKYMTSQLAYGLYQLRNGQNFLRLFCQLSIMEGRYDKKAFEAYKEALKLKVYIPDLENHYIYASWQVQEDIKLDLLKHFMRIDQLDIPIREFIYLNVIRERLGHDALYRRIYPEVIQYIEETSHYSITLIKIIRLMFDELLRDKKDIVYKMITIVSIQSLSRTAEGMECVLKLIEICIHNNPILHELQRSRIFEIIVKALGYVGVAKLFGDKAEIIYHYCTSNSRYRMNNEIMEYHFLPNEYFAKLNNKEELKELLLKKILCDDFIEVICDDFERLDTSSQEEIESYYYHYLGGKIIVDDYQISEPVFVKMYRFYQEKQKNHIGLLIALLKVLSKQCHVNKWLLENLLIEAKKHDIIVPWFGEENSPFEFDSIFFLSHPKDEVTIRYRYEDNDTFLEDTIHHLAYGLFNYHIKLFYGECFEYYLVIRHMDGSVEIPVSALMKKSDIKERRDEQVDYRLDSIALSYEMDDGLSARELIYEQLKVEQILSSIPRM